jgi:hypothetical protein
MRCLGRPIDISNSRNVPHEANFRPQTGARYRRLRGAKEALLPGGLTELSGPIAPEIRMNAIACLDYALLFGS